MTWGGLQGFQKEPSDKFYVPYKDGSEVGGAGFVGKTHRERGLTWVTVDLAGHGKLEYFNLVPGRSLTHIPRNPTVCSYCCIPYARVHAWKSPEPD